MAEGKCSGCGFSGPHDQCPIGEFSCPWMAMAMAVCSICDPRPEATQEECDKWPGHYCGCIIRDHGPTNGWTCDGKGKLTKADESLSQFRSGEETK